MVHSLVTIFLIWKASNACAQSLFPAHIFCSIYAQQTALNGDLPEMVPKIIFSHSREAKLNVVCLFRSSFFISCTIVIEIGPSALNRHVSMDTTSSLETIP